MTVLERLVGMIEYSPQGVALAVVMIGASLWFVVLGVREYRA